MRKNWDNIKYILKISKKRLLVCLITNNLLMLNDNYLLALSLIAAWAAAKRATGTRNGEHET